MLRQCFILFRWMILLYILMGFSTHFFHMPEINGIQLAEQLLEKKSGLHIVFVTAYGEYAVDAFELNAIDYVLKPVGQERLIKTIQRIKSKKKEAFASTSKLDTMYISTFPDVTISVGGHIIPLRWWSR